MYPKTKLLRTHSQLSLQKTTKIIITAPLPNRSTTGRGGKGGVMTFQFHSSSEPYTWSYHILPNVCLVYVHQTIKLKWFLKFVQSFFLHGNRNFCTCTEFSVREVFHSVFASSCRTSGFRFNWSYSPGGKKLIVCKKGNTRSGCCLL